MKKLFFVLAVSSALAACSGNRGPSRNDSTDNANAGAAAHQSEAAQETTINNTGTEKTNPGTSKPSNPGAQLIAKSDCLGCHKEHGKLVGPAYADVAKKYSSKDIDMLADKVIKGGSGNWGDVPMTPHPQLSVDSAKLMVKYILSVK